METVGLDTEGALVPRFGRDPLAAFRAVRTPDHSVRLLDDPTPEAVIPEHADHVAAASSRRGASPVGHTDRDHALRLATQHTDHMTRVVQRWRLVGSVAGIIVLLTVGGLFLWFAVASRFSAGQALLLDLVLIPVGLASIISVNTLLSKLAWWRPPYLVDR